MFKVRLINNLNPELHIHNSIADIITNGITNIVILNKNIPHVMIKLSPTILFVTMSAIMLAMTNGIVHVTKIFKYSVKGILKPSLKN